MSHTLARVRLTLLHKMTFWYVFLGVWDIFVVEAYNTTNKRLASFLAQFLVHA